MVGDARTLDDNLEEVKLIFDIGKTFIKTDSVCVLKNGGKKRTAILN